MLLDYDREVQQQIFGVLRRMEQKIDMLEILVCELLNRDQIRNLDHEPIAYAAQSTNRYKPSDNNRVANPDGKLKKKKKTDEDPTLFDSLYKGAYPDPDEIPF